MANVEIEQRPPASHRRILFSRSAPQVYHLMTGLKRAGGLPLCIPSMVVAVHTSFRGIYTLNNIVDLPARLA